MRRDFPECFTIQIEMGHAIKKSQNSANEMCKHLVLRGHCVKQISPVSLRLCNIYWGHVEVQIAFFINTWHIKEWSMSFAIHSR